MSFDRFITYKKIADKYKGEELDTNTLAWKCRESAPKKWQVVNSNSIKTFRGEQRKELIDPNTGKRTIMMYRCTHEFDQTLFCMLMVRMQGYILHHWKTVQKYLEVDEFLDEMEEAIFQTLIRYDIDKGRFESLANTMLNNFKVNLIEKYVPYDSYKVNGKIKKTYHYDQAKVSLEDILDNPNCYLYQSLPTTTLFDKEGDGTISELKKKYKDKQDLLTWLILDFQENDPEINNCGLINKELKYKKFSTNNVLQLYTSIEGDEKLRTQLGFKSSLNTKSLKQKYKESIYKLRNEIKNVI